MKPRFNQPKGYRPTGSAGPSYYYGRRHDYIFYPVSWTDTASGTHYEKGYYDENGTRYDNVSFEQNGKFENVVCRCQYCGQETILNLTSEETSSKSLQCPACGAPLDIVSELDEYIEDKTESGRIPYTADQSGYSYPQTKKRMNPVVRILLIAVGIFFVLGFVGMMLPDSSAPEEQYYTLGEDGYYGDTLVLSKTADGSYVIDGPSEDKTLVYEDDTGNYYDADTECWLWFNTDVEPAVWQYWYEGISSDFGDYGWLEHDSEGWWIEESAGNWIALPDKYDTSGLWYLEDQP